MSSKPLANPDDPTRSFVDTYRMCTFNLLRAAVALRDISRKIGKSKLRVGEAAKQDLEAALEILRDMGLLIDHTQPEEPTKPAPGASWQQQLDYALTQVTNNQDMVRAILDGAVGVGMTADEYGRMTAAAAVMAANTYPRASVSP